MVASQFYTGTGDSGSTIIGGGRVLKNDPLVHAIGDINELNAWLGVALQNVSDEMVSKQVHFIQNELFVIGAELASIADKRFTPKRAIADSDVEALQQAVEEVGGRAHKLKSFVLPGGPAGAAYLDLAATVARRTERTIVELMHKANGRKLNPAIEKYLNRLSSYLFWAARAINAREGVDEERPTY